MLGHASYAPVSAQEEDTTTTHFALPAQDHHAPLKSPPAAYLHMEEARHLTWMDSFYDGKHGIIAAFDRDAVTAGNRFMWRFLRSACFLWGVSVMYWILGAIDLKYNSEEESIIDDIFGVYTLILGGFFAVMALRGRQAMLAQHVAVTCEGIRVDNGTMVTITIPFEHVVKVIVAPYRFCCRTDETFQTVTVHRGAAPLEQMCCQKTKALELYGILRAQEFADLVMAMKDSQDHGTYEGLEEHRLELQTLPRVEVPESSTSS